MLFSNAIVYRLTEALDVDTDAFLAGLSERAFTPCTGLQPHSFGWVQPIPGEATVDGEMALWHEVAGCFLLCARREDKVIPPSALKEAIVERVEQLEAREGRRLRSKEKLAIKDDALAELLPRALPRSKQIMGYIAPADDLLVVGTASPTEADLFLGCLRESLPGIRMTIPQLKGKPVDIFTRWLTDRRLPEPFSLGDQCDLIDVQDGARASCRQQDLATQEVLGHIENGKTCTRIGVRWHGDFSFAIDKDLILRQVKFEAGEEPDAGEDDPIAALDAEFANIALTFRQVIPALFSALGGEQRE